MEPSTTKISQQNENSSTQKQENPFHTDTTRLLYLSSELRNDSEPIGVPLKASISVSPTHKIWILPPLQEGVSQYQVNLRNLNIFHTWRSVTSPRTLHLQSSEDPNPEATITIPSGDWNAQSLASYLTEQLEAANVPVVVEYDSGILGFHFTPAVYILAPTDCQDLLGFPDDFMSLIADHHSTIPVRMSGPSRLHINSNLSLFTYPPSGRLATIPVSVNYGELLNYFDESGTQPSLCMDHNIQRIELHITDQDNNELEAYDEIPWGVILSITPVQMEAFSSAMDPFIRPTTNDVIIEG